MHPIKRFNVRVYGLLINDLRQILLADEVFRNGNRATKYPGGGLELGEGPIEGLIREFREEAAVEVAVTEHFYTTDFFQPSYFDNESQIISIYFLCKSAGWQKIKTTDKKYDFEIVQSQEAESFRWVRLSELDKETDITLPIDKIVTEKLIKSWKV